MVPCWRESIKKPYRERNAEGPQVVLAPSCLSFLVQVPDMSDEYVLKWIQPCHILNTVSSKILTWNFVVESFLYNESKKQQMIVKHQVTF